MRHRQAWSLRSLIGACPVLACALAQAATAVRVQQDPFERLAEIDAGRIASSWSSLPALQPCEARATALSAHALALAEPERAAEATRTGPFDLIDPRYVAQIDASAQWRCGFAQAVLQYQAAPSSNPLAFDGSAVGWQFGEHWQLAAGRIARRWGPSWDGSLILGTAAQPFDSVSVEAASGPLADSHWWWWLGDVRFSGFVGRLEGNRHDFSHPALSGLRVVIRPWPILELGASRVAQMGGEGRSLSLRTFWDAFLGKDNQVDANGNSAPQPGNQLGGFDARLSLQPWLSGVAVYGQMIGEDEAAHLPSKYMHQLGIEWRHAHGLLFLEGVDTTASLPGVAYNHHVYTDGYRFRGRPLGDWADGDSRLLTLGALLPALAGGEALAVLRQGRLNREAINPTWPRSQLFAAGLQWRRLLARGLRLTLSADYLSLSDTAAAALSQHDTQLRLMLEWWPGE